MKTINGINVLNSLEEFADPERAALVVIDMQNDFCHPNGLYAQCGKDIASTVAIVPGTLALARAAQTSGVLCVFVRQQTLPNNESDSPAWLRFKCRDGKRPEYTLKGSWGAEFVDGLVPGPSDLVIEKFRPDAFVKTSIDGLLRARGIESLIVLGTSTEGCVESTVRGGSYHDYYVVVVGDLVSSCHPVLHEGSLRLMQARYPIATAAQIRGVWNGALKAETMEERP